MIDADPPRRGGTADPIGIGIIATYFGDWPPWFPAFLVSCAGNPTVDWLIFTDCPAPTRLPPNVRTIPFSMDRLNELAALKTGVGVRKRLYSQCDLRPAYGLIFEDYLRGYDFWGHCDLDVVWGDIRRYITDPILRASDVVSSRQGQMAGHLSLWRNEPRVNRLFEAVDGWKEHLETPEHRVFDEDTLTAHFRSNGVPRIYWDDLFVTDYYHLEARPYGWRWVDGKVLGPDGEETCYLHFMTWKRYMKRIDFGYGDSPREFAVRRRGIWAGRPPAGEVAMARLDYDRWFRRAIGVKRSLERLTWTVMGAAVKRKYEKAKRRKW